MAILNGNGTEVELKETSEEPTPSTPNSGETEDLTAKYITQIKARTPKGVSIKHAVVLLEYDNGEVLPIVGLDVGLGATAQPSETQVRRMVTELLYRMSVSDMGNYTANMAGKSIFAAMEQVHNQQLQDSILADGNLRNLGGRRVK